DAKLALAQFLLGCDDLVECARRSLDWLAEHTPVSHAVCAAVDPDFTRLVGVAGRGVPATAVMKFVVDLQAGDDPLVAMLVAGQPRSFPDAGRHPATPPGPAPFLAVPMRGVVGDEQVPAGVLLARPGGPTVAHEVAWLAEVLGHRLVRPRFYGRLVRERGLLHTIINTVPDAILLTDSEGRIVIANS